MTTDTTPAPIAHTTDAQIADCKRHAAELENIIAEVGAALYAIDAGGFFMSLPEAEEDRERHNQGTWLLAMIGHRLASIKGFGDELSAKLSRLSRDSGQEAA